MYSRADSFYTYFIFTNSISPNCEVTKVMKCISSVKQGSNLFYYKYIESFTRPRYKLCYLGTANRNI